MRAAPGGPQSYFRTARATALRYGTRGRAVTEDLER
jgi:hypothetical protein